MLVFAGVSGVWVTIIFLVVVYSETFLAAGSKAFQG
jgi:hypothetical protein